MVCHEGIGFSLKTKFGDDEEIKIKASMFDEAVSAPKSEGALGLEHVKFRHTMIVRISRKEGGNVMDIICSAWPDRTQIDKLFICRPQMPAQPYAGPNFKKLDVELQGSLYEFLETRGISDELAVLCMNA